MAKQIMVDENNLKRQARRRLIGAVVLVTIVVAVLPMLLDSEPKSVVKDIELRIPDKNKAGGFVTNAALPSVPAVAQPAASPEIAPAITSTVASGAAVVSQAAVASQAIVASQASGAPQQAASKPAAAPEQKPASAAPDEVAHKEQAAQQSEFIIQIGAFSNADTAHRWQKNLVKQGIKAYTEKAGDKLRVRAGPYATREAAEKVRHRLESQGLHPNIIAQE